MKKNGNVLKEMKGAKLYTTDGIGCPTPWQAPGSTRDEKLCKYKGLAFASKSCYAQDEWHDCYPGKYHELSNLDAVQWGKKYQIGEAIILKTEDKGDNRPHECRDHCRVDYEKTAGTGGCTHWAIGRSSRYCYLLTSSPSCSYFGMQRRGGCSDEATNSWGTLNATQRKQPTSADSNYSLI